MTLEVELVRLQISFTPIPNPMKNHASRLISRLFMALLCSAMVWQTQAQDRAFVLCEGAQDFYSGEVLESPRIGVIDLSAPSPSFEVLRVFEGHSFAVDLALSEDASVVFVAAEDTVFKLDAFTGEVLAQQALDGARNVHLQGDRVFVTRGDVDPVTWGSVDFEHYIVALDAQDLSWDSGWAAAGNTGPAFASEGMAVSNGGIFVAVNNAFAYGEEVGRIGRIDLTTGAYTEADLGPDGLNPVHLFAGDGGAVVSVNAQQYDGTSLSRWDGATDAATEVVANVTAGCGAADWYEGSVLYQIYGEAGFRKADGGTLEALEGWNGNGGSVYTMSVLSPDQTLLGTTDFSTEGVVELWDFDAGLQWSIPVGIAPGTIAVASFANAIAEAPGSRTLVGTVDLLGRPHVSGNGILLHQWSDGTVTKELRLTD